MHLHFKTNTTQRPNPIEKINQSYIPTYNLPDTPSIQLSVHSPFFLPSPHNGGYNYLGGRSYDLSVSMKVKHLLPSPYQTNCTDYMKIWRERGGKAPIEQLAVIQECMMNISLISQGCVPKHIKYPHNFKICKEQQKDTSNNTLIHQCSLSAVNYNQPCDSISYSVTKMDEKDIKSPIMQLNFMQQDCSGNKVWQPECGMVKIHIFFDSFEITNLTYYPRYESLELVSVIGGYLGVWLGASLVAVYDLIGESLVRIINRKKPGKHIPSKIVKKFSSKKEIAFLSKIPKVL
nr:uncharacterized protein LOC107447721 isoform X1 [Parasteatoda tepidariorum]